MNDAGFSVTPPHSSARWLLGVAAGIVVAATALAWAATGVLPAPPPEPVATIPPGTALAITIDSGGCPSDPFTCATDVVVVDRASATVPTLAAIERLDGTPDGCGPDGARAPGLTVMAVTADGTRLLMDICGLAESGILAPRPAVSPSPTARTR